MVRPKLDSPRGILHRRADAPLPGHRRFHPDAALAPFVEHYWTVSWDVEVPVIREVLPHPSIHLVVERESTRIVGIPRSRFRRRIEGRGRVLGVKFRPGGFRPFADRSAHRLTGRVLALDEVLGSEAGDLEDRVLAHEDPGAAFAVLEEWLLERRPPGDDDAEWIAALVERAAEDPDLRRVDQLAAMAGRSARSLQRLFAEYVGVSPKWVLQRCRLHEAAERIAAGEVLDWAALALDLGYSDQSHLIRDFRRWVGRSPGEYAGALESGDRD